MPPPSPLAVNRSCRSRRDLETPANLLHSGMLDAALTKAALLWLSILLAIGAAPVRQRAAPVPTTWEDKAIAGLEVPLANPVGSPKHVAAEYYYRIPVAPIYKVYPVYAPGREPAGYWERLTHQDPEIAWDDAGHRPVLASDADWVRAASWCSTRL
jgi:hypothetical protein